MFEYFTDGLPKTMIKEVGKKLRSMIKKFIAVCVAFGCLQTGLIAQENNPFNQHGVDYFRSLEIISYDFKAGKVTEFTEESLAYYSKTLPLTGTATVDMAASIIKKVKSENNNLNVEINKMPIALVGKEALLGMVRNYSQMNTSDYLNYLSSQCKVLSSSDIPDFDKQFVLTIIAIAYNGSQNQNFSGNVARNADCTISADGVSEGIPCWLAGVVIGGSFGAGIPGCGLPCIIGGAIIGGIVGSLS